MVASRAVSLQLTHQEEGRTKGKAVAVVVSGNRSSRGFVKSQYSLEMSESILSIRKDLANVDLAEHN